MPTIKIHAEVFNDLDLCLKKKWYKTLGEEMPRVCRLLMHDLRLPGESLVRYIKLQILQNKTFHARINLPEENIGKQAGSRIIFVKEDPNLIKVIYVGGHKDKRYDDSNLAVPLIEDRYQDARYVDYFEGINFLDQSSQT
ncbi:MAG: hypothetical protein UT24_C0042G0002 [Candidatus Woesebacteria bacterium GW2011_GWB1_39_12]|uniref:Uncharacterized protein n=2 Tax=Patescibacteria group TaxID=1783273 RepID=A0A1F8DMV5_9BACT|nr:MAG: hypothetical protein UT24_C0042G0002 [Candidatus Woesebacteria bacterium GW2011_GWB1_39_12]OGM89115.1 MAG: hypothetical protein A2108_01950 [Candidatus Wolfebacteria bacterium GWA1_42_9]